MPGFPAQGEVTKGLEVSGDTMPRPHLVIPELEAYPAQGQAGGWLSMQDIQQLGGLVSKNQRTDRSGTDCHS